MVDIVRALLGVNEPKPPAKKAKKAKKRQVKAPSKIKNSSMGDAMSEMLSRLTTLEKRVSGGEEE